MSNLLVKWTPFDAACRFRSLQQGRLNVGNTAQNKTNLYNLAVAQANSPSNPPWAQWRTATVNTAQVHSNLLLNVPLVPGYTPPPGTYGYNAPGVTTITAATYSGRWTGWSGSASTPPAATFGSVSPVSPTLNGDTLWAIYYDATFSLVYLALDAVVTKSFFNSLSFTDRASTVETYLTASAGFNNPGGSYSLWSWTSLYAGAGNPFSSGGVYPITFS
jgi:hypothetical protein